MFAPNVQPAVNRQPDYRWETRRASFLIENQWFSDIMIFCALNPMLGSAPALRQVHGIERPFQETSIIYVSTISR